MSGSANVTTDESASARAIARPSRLDRVRALTASDSTRSLTEPSYLLPTLPRDETGAPGHGRRDGGARGCGFAARRRHGAGGRHVGLLGSWHLDLDLRREGVLAADDGRQCDRS